MNSGKLLRKVILILFLGLLLSSLTSCKPRVVYLKGGQEVIRVNEGETLTVPGPAWVTTDEGMAGYYDYLQRKIKERESD